MIALRRRLFLLAVLLLFSGAAFARGGGGCFLPGTLVQTPGGSIPIEQLLPGQAVLSFDGNSVVQSTVSEIYTVQRDYYYEISAGGSLVRVTAEHPFYIGNGEFENVSQLKEGDTIYALANGTLAPVRIDSVSLLETPATAYNLHTDSPNTFFAGGFAVHNKGGGGGGGGGGFHSSSSHSSSSGGSYYPPPNTYYYECNRTYNESGQERQCCLQTITKTYAQGAEINITGYPFCTCTPNGTASTFPGNGSICYCSSGVPYNPYGASNPPVCPADPLMSALSLMFGICPAIPFIFMLVFFFAVAKALTSGRLGGGSFGEWSSTASAPSGKVMAKAGKVSALLSFWSKIDSAWGEPAMKERATSTFLKLQECWGKREYADMEPLLAPSLYAQHIAQLEAMAARHEINRMDNLKLLDLQIVLVKRFDKKEKDEFTAWIKATACDTIVDDRTGKKMRGDAGNGVFEEFWTFARDGDSWRLREIDQPEEGMHVIGEQSFDESATPMLMQSLQERSTTGKQDTSVDAMREQGGDDGAPSVGEIKGKGDKIHNMLNFLAQTDRIWDERTMLEFTRTLFILLSTSVEKRSLSRVAISLKPALLATIQANVDGMKKKGLLAEKGNLAIRNVEIVLIRNFNDKTRDEFVAWVSGQAQSMLVDEKSGEAVSGDSYVRDFEEYWTFVREGGEWKLAAIDDSMAGAGKVREENVDEGTSKDMLQWYYTKDRAL